jgi:hypothetical protein
LNYILKLYLLQEILMGRAKGYCGVCGETWSIWPAKGYCFLEDDGRENGKNKVHLIKIILEVTCSLFLWCFKNLGLL